VGGWRLGGIAWAPDGRSLLVAATSANDPGEFGLLQFVTAEPFSGRISQWTSTGSLVTPHPRGRGVIAGAISPDGRRLAVLADTTGGRFRLLLTEPTDLMLRHATVTSVAGCALAWRSDGLELAVVVASDPACATPAGPIFGLSVAKPESLEMIVLKGQNPAWQPVSLAVPKTPGSGG
jgi:dipeptidyl aminopeptidase/acylaminoacyl peptidase